MLSKRIDQSEKKILASASAAGVMKAYRARRNAQRKSILSRYQVLGYLSSGTYGRVYKAKEVGTCLLYTSDAADE